MIALAAGPTAVAAKKKGGGGKGAAPAAANPADPVSELDLYVQHIDALLALDRSGPPKAVAWASQASGNLTVIRGKLAAKRGAAEPPEQARLDAAIATCDVISRSLDEREKAVAQINANATVAGDNKLNRKRQDDPKRRELIREQLENREARKDARKTDSSLTAGAQQRWTQRSVELRNQVQAAYAKIATAGKG
jgi:hypothetical protein